MKMYRVNKYSMTIEEMEVIKITKKTISYIRLFIDSDNYNKITEPRISGRIQWFDKWDEAHNFLLNMMQERIDHCICRLDGAERDFEKVKNMCKPEGAT